MRQAVIKFALLVMMAIPQMLHADMSSYCSAPPYVTRSIVPNIMVLMDNSEEMLEAAHPTTYAPTAGVNNYMGYFKPTGCYQYSSSKFVEVLNTSVTPNRTYLAGEACPSTAPFRGNLMNWAVMSKYDILQKVLIGGNAVSKQGNAHTLLSISGSWTKTHSGCQFIVNGGSLTVKDVTSGSCSLIASTPSPIALSPLKTFWEMFSKGTQRIYGVVAGGVRDVTYVVAMGWEKFDMVTKAWAAQLEISIQSGTLNGTVGIPYSITFEGGGDNNTTYSWNFNPSPPASWLSGPTYSTSGQKNNYRATWSGTPSAAGTHAFTVTLSDNQGNTQDTADYTITITAGALIINTPSLPPGEVGVPYSVQLTGQGGVPSLTWSATGLPPGLSINATTGVISGTPTTSGTYTIVVTMTDSTGATVSKTFSNIQIAAATGLNSVNYSVKIELIEEPFTDLNGNGIWDLGETYTDSNGNGSWEGKDGIFQKFWDANNPRARWGLTKFGQTGGVTTVGVDACIPASPASSFYTRIQNAQPVNDSPLAKGVFGDVNYYGFNSPYGTGYNGCSGADPIDDVPCRKNFLLILSSGHDVSGTAGEFSTTAACSQADLLVRNACIGYTTDLREEEEKEGKQKMYTYVVNTMGTTNNAILEAAALAGGGKYYDASDSANLQQQLTNALTDILAQAASGTAVSVLTTSSRGIGSMVQAYFLPVKQEGTREVLWTGYTQNLWIDSTDNLREDTTNDYKLKPNSVLPATDGDKVIKLYFDTTTNETKVATFTTLADGSGGTLAACTATGSAIKPFSDINYLWEAGKKLANRITATSPRNIFTAKKVVKGETNPLYTFANNEFTATNVVTNNPFTLGAALDEDATYSATDIVNYVRGEDVESTDTNFRDRRVTVGGTLKVWRLGDVISSTPKVFANTPNNTYHIDYGDSSYHSYVSGNSYKQRSSIAFVGANDGMLHAFRMGYLKDKDLETGAKALFKNFFLPENDDTENDQLGDEVWGYVPFNAFPYLKYLANPAYCHIYFNDLSVRLVDASLGGGSSPDPDDPKISASWKTILIGGMRFGGACNAGTPAPPPGPPAAGVDVGYSVYYAIDITNPESPNPLWEFSDPDMGYATTFPSIIRTGPKGENGNWYVAIGSGSKQLPKSNTDISRASTGYIYLLNLKTGALVKKIGLDHNAIVGDILAIDEDRDYQSEKIYFGTAHKPGTSWAGKLVSLSIPTDVTGLCGSGVSRSSADCGTGLKNLFTGSYPFTASPDATRDPSGNVWVYAGSGKYYSDVDESDTAAQVFMGIKDKSSDITYPLTIATAAGTDIDNRSGATYDTIGDVTGTTTACLFNGTEFEPQTLVTSINQTSGAVSVPERGWYVNLSTGERVITRPLAVGGLVDFLTYMPSSDACSYGGDSYLYSLGYTTGVAPSSVAIRAPETTGGVTTIGASVTVAKRVLLGPGAPPTGEAIIIPPPKEGQETLKKKIQIATGVIVEAENAPVLSVVSKIVHWLKK